MIYLFEAERGPGEMAQRLKVSDAVIENPDSDSSTYIAAHDHL